MSDCVLEPQRASKAPGKIDNLTASYRRWRDLPAMLAWLDEMNTTQRWVILDTETTGFQAGSEVVEITVLSSQGSILFTSLVNPSTEIEPMATSTHGLRRQDVYQAPRYPEIHQALCEVLRDVTILGYNVSFDIRLLAQTARRYQLVWPGYHVACLMYGYAHLRQPSKRLARPAICRLEVACEEMGIPQPLRHRAPYDAYAVYSLFQQMVATSLGTRGKVRAIEAACAASL